MQKLNPAVLAAATAAAFTATAATSIGGGSTGDPAGIATAAVDWDSAYVAGRTNGDKCFYAPGEEMVFTLELKDVRGKLPTGVYFYDWVRTANDGKVEKGRGPAEKPLVIRTRLGIPGFVKIEANIVTADGKRVPKKHLWEKRVFFQGGAGVAVDKLEAWPEPEDFDDYWAALKRLANDAPLVVEERVKIPCANEGLDLYRMKIKAPDGISGWLWDYKTWFAPGVGEQFGWEMPIDGSAVKLIRIYLALYAAEGNPLDLAKARTLGDSIVNIQKEDGSVRTQWLLRPDADNFWLNCLTASAEALELLSIQH